MRNREVLVVLFILGGGCFQALGLCAEETGTGHPIELSADTNRPELILFAPGEPIKLFFKARGPDPTQEDLELILNITDEHDVPIEKREVPVVAQDNGSWGRTVDAPHARLGFNRVNAKLSNGVTIDKLYTRPAGFISYAVVPDPGERLSPSTRLSNPVSS